MLLKKISKINIFYLIGLIILIFLALIIFIQLPFFNPKSQTSNLTVLDQPQPGQVAVLDSNIVINTPLSNQSISSPVEISGRARVFEGLVLFRVRDSQNNILATSSSQTDAGAQAWGQYEVTLGFPKPLTPAGFVEVYTESARDGSDQDLIKIPVKFSDFVSPIVSIFFSNINEDPEFLDCNQVYPVQRELESYDQLVSQVLIELFNGLTADDLKAGFVTNLPEEGVVLQKIEISTSTIRIDFNQALQQDVSGACRVEAIRAQITQTLKQFKEIDEVIISIDGESEEILQP